ncbi:MAG TPA: orotidine-5'-phosphate decarboxylase [Firmicutes bacterium]|nr:orotidine-5'-phosphate decarboxylase [Bacillota bacterium]
MHFADKLNGRINSTGSRVVIGIDPDPKRLLADQSKFKAAFPGKSDEFLLDAFCSTIIEVAKTYACAVKPQAAFFESMGLMGWKALASCIQNARKHAIPVILDAKRGDIGHTAGAYAKAYLDPGSELFADALTVNPYLGPDTLHPFMNMASQNGCGLFVLVKTSNPGSHAFQDLKVSDEPDASPRTVAAKVAECVNSLGESHIGKSGFSNIGAVVGATYPEHLDMMRQVMPKSILLVPGYGAQGGTPGDVKAAFYPGGTGAVVSSSRGIIFAYENLPQPSDNGIYEAMANAAEKARDDINSVALP